MRCGIEFMGRLRGGNPVPPIGVSEMVMEGNIQVHSFQAQQDASHLSVIRSQGF